MRAKQKESARRHGPHDELHDGLKAMVYEQHGAGLAVNRFQSQVNKVFRAFNVR